MKSNEQLCLNCNEHFSFLCTASLTVLVVLCSFLVFYARIHMFLCVSLSFPIAVLVWMFCVFLLCFFYFLFSSFYVLSVSVFNIETWFNLRHWYSWFSIRSCIQRKQIIVYNVLDSYAGNAV